MPLDTTSPFGITVPASTTGSVDRPCRRRVTLFVLSSPVIALMMPAAILGISLCSIFAAPVSVGSAIVAAVADETATEFTVERATKHCSTAEAEAAEPVVGTKTSCPEVPGNPTASNLPTNNPSPALTRFEYAQKLMGMRFDILVYAPTEEVATRAANAAFDRIRELNAIMSDYEPESELMQLCRTAGSGRVVPVSRDLWSVLQISQQLSESTNGAFDVTVGPCVRLWRTARRTKAFPPDDRLAAARQLVGYRNLIMNDDQKSVSLQKPGMQLDLGGIAVGYALDSAREVFIQHGLPCFLLDGSGDVLAGEPPPGAAGWKIGLTPVDNPDGASSRFISLKNAAVTTSGDAWQHVELNGQRYSHIVDPRTGLGLTTRATVTVVAPTATTADAFATAVSVLGAIEGSQLIEKTPGAAAMIVENRDGKFVVSETQRLNDYLLHPAGGKPATETSTAEPPAKAEPPVASEPPSPSLEPRVEPTPSEPKP